MAFWKKDEIFWKEELAISSSKLILWEESITFGKNDWKIQKEKGALWGVVEALWGKKFSLLKDVYISPGEKKLPETEENNLCGNFGSAVDTENETVG